MEYNVLYSMLVGGDIAVVDAIMKKHGVKYREGNWYPGKGYDFILAEDCISAHPVLEELIKCPDVDYYSFAYITSAKDIDEFFLN